MMMVVDPLFVSKFPWMVVSHMIKKKVKFIHVWRRNFKQFLYSLGAKGLLVVDTHASSAYSIMGLFIYLDHRLQQ